MAISRAKKEELVTEYVARLNGSDAIIITDYRASIEQALTLIHLLDTRYFDVNTIELIQVRYNQAVDVAEIGPRIETDPLFPERANVEFVEIGAGIFRMGSTYLAEGGDWLGRICAPLGLPCFITAAAKVGSALANFQAASRSRKLISQPRWRHSSRARRSAGRLKRGFGPVFFANSTLGHSPDVL